MGVISYIPENNPDAILADFIFLLSATRTKVWSVQVAEKFVIRDGKVIYDKNL